MTSRKALILTDQTRLTTRPYPTLRPDRIIVKTVAVALNPTDWKQIDVGRPEPGCVVGCDYAGIVEEVGSEVQKPFKKGDRICGLVYGLNERFPEDGAFADYIVVKGDLQIKIPDNLSFEEAATIGVGVCTVGQGLYQTMKLAWPTEPISDGTPLLIYGGSSATGTLAIQFAKASGYTVITTCSPHNFDLVKKLGADHVFDYRDPNTPSEIRKLTDDKLKYAYDTIGSDPAPKVCDGALSTSGGTYVAITRNESSREDVSFHITLAYTVFGEGYKAGNFEIPPSEEDKISAMKFWEVAEKLLASGKVKPHPLTVGKDGLKGASEGLQQMKEGKVSGVKLVYRIADTP